MSQHTASQHIDIVSQQTEKSKHSTVAKTFLTMFAKQASLLPGSTDRRRESHESTSRAGLFSGMRYNRRGEEDLDPVSSSDTEESETFHDAKVQAENVEDYEPSELFHGPVSESSSADSSSSEDTAEERSIVYVESEEDNERGIVGVLNMGCMDGFFMPGRAASVPKSLVELDENGDKALKFDMKIPIAMGFRNSSTNDDKDKPDSDGFTDHDALETDRRNPAQSFGSVMSCRASNCRSDQNTSETLEKHNLPQIRQQPTMDPPAKVAGSEPPEQFQSLMSLSHDGSSCEDGSESNILAEHMIVPTPPPPLPFPQYQLNGQQNMRGSQQRTPIQMLPPGWNKQHLYQNPVTVSSTYEMVVVNGVMPPYQYGYGHLQSSYWNGPYPANHPPTIHRPMEPPAIEKLPSQILVEHEELTIGEDPSCLSYDGVPPPHTADSRIAAKQRFAGLHILQTSHQHPQGNTPHARQGGDQSNSKLIQNDFLRGISPVRRPLDNPEGMHGSEMQLRSFSSPSPCESEDDFQDSVQILPDELFMDRSKADDRSSSSASSSGGKPPRVQRWREANLRRLQVKPTKSNVSSKPPLVPTVSPNLSKLTSPRVEGTKQQKKEHTTSYIDSRGQCGNDDDDDDEEQASIDSDQAIVDTITMEKNIKSTPQTMKPPVEEERSNASSVSVGSSGSSESSPNVTLDSNSSKSDASSNHAGIEQDDEDSSASSVKVGSSASSESTSNDTLGSNSSESDVSSHHAEQHEEDKRDSTENDRIDNSEFSADNQINTGNEVILQIVPSESSKDNGKKSDKGPGSFLMFDSIYTRRRQRRDAAKQKMTKFLESKKIDLVGGTENPPQDNGRQEVQRTGQSSRVSRLARTRLARMNVLTTPDKETSCGPAKLDGETKQKHPTNRSSDPSDSPLTSILLSQNKKTALPKIETAERSDVVLQPVIVVPGHNSPSKGSLREPGSPPKRVSMSNMARASQTDRNVGVKLSLSLKTTMTNEFHDVMSSESVENFIEGAENSTPRGLQLQPTMTSEWHDALDAVHSPTTTGLASKMDIVVATSSEISLPVDEPPGGQQQYRFR